jgi:hypothetical protein
MGRRVDLLKCSQQTPHVKVEEDEDELVLLVLLLVELPLLVLLLLVELELAIAPTTCAVEMGALSHIQFLCHQVINFPSN